MPLYLFFIFVFPQQYIEFLVFFYEPITRLSVIAIFITLFILYQLKKHHTEQKYDYLKDLSITQAKINAKEYFYNLSLDSKNDKIILNMYINGVYGYDFLLKFEKKLEKKLKFFKLIHECQSGDKQFDNEIFIVSDDKVVCDSLKKEKKLRETTFNLFWLYKNDDFNIKFIKYFDGRLTLYAQKKQIIEDDTEQKTKQIIEKSVIALHDMLPYLPKRAQKDAPIYREKTGKYIFILWGVLHLFFLNGLIKIILDSTSIFMLPNLVNETELLLPSLYISLGLLFIYLILVTKIFYKSTRLAMSIFIGITYGMAGFYLSALTGLKELNIYLDNSKPIIRHEQVVNIRESYGRRHTSFHITFSKLDEIKTNGSFYKRFKISDRVNIYEKSGYLNMAWIYKIEKENSTKGKK